MSYETPRQIIETARVILNDYGSGTPRQSNIELLEYFNLSVAEASTQAEDLMTVIGDMDCDPGETEQAVSFRDVQTLINVLRISNGAAVQECDMQTLNRFNPNWSQDEAAPALNWMRASGGDPRRFYIYPKAPVGQVLEVSYVKNPKVYDLDEPIYDLPLRFRVASVDYVVFRAESKDDEHVSSGRAVAHYNKFLSDIGAKSLAAKPSQPSAAA